MLLRYSKVKTQKGREEKYGGGKSGKEGSEGGDRKSLHLTKKKGGGERSTRRGEKGLAIPHTIALIYDRKTT